MFKQHLPWLLCALVALIGAPALATGTEREADATVDAFDNEFRDRADQDTNVAIAAGEKVTFVSAIVDGNAGAHNVDFRDAKPTACRQTKQSPEVNLPLDVDGPPMPDYALPPGWEGWCQFDEPGTYEFYCTVHGGMEGTVTVGPGSPTPTPTATPTSTPTATPDPEPRIRSATFKRSKRTVTVSGTVEASGGKVRVELRYRVGSKTRKKSRSLPVRNEKFSGKFKLSAADARKAKKLKLTATFGDEKATKTVKVRR